MTRDIALVVLFLVCGCSDKPASIVTPASSGEATKPASSQPVKTAAPQPDFVFTAAQLAELSLQDDAGAGDKYKSKYMEVTGTFCHLGEEKSSSQLNLVLRGVKDPQRPRYYQDVCCFFDLNEFTSILEPLALSFGQTITIRGTSSHGSFNCLNDCKVVKTGLATATATSIAEVEKAIAAQKLTSSRAPEGIAPYVEKDVLMRIKIKAKNRDWTIEPPAGSTRKFYAEAPFMNNAYSKKFEACKPGDEVIVLATVNAYAPDEIKFSEVRVLDKVPDGLKLP